MAANNESSVLFSLKELVNLEADRLRREEDEKKQRDNEALAARVDAERRAREAELARIEAAEAQRRAAEQRAREEATRLDAIRLAEVERARVAAENAARLEALKRQQEHERELTALKEQSGRKKLVVVLGALAFALVTAIGIGGYVIHEANRAAATAQAEAQRLIEQKNAIDDRMKELEREKAGKSAAERAELEARIQKLEDDKKKLLDQQRERSTSGPRSPTAVPAPQRQKPAGCQPKCAKGDPLCVECP